MFQRASPASTCRSCQTLGANTVAACNPSIHIHRTRTAEALFTVCVGRPSAGGRRTGCAVPAGAGPGLAHIAWSCWVARLQAKPLSRPALRCSVSWQGCCLTLPSSRRPTAGFAHCWPRLTANVRPLTRMFAACKSLLESTARSAGSGNGLGFWAAVVQAAERSGCRRERCDCRRVLRRATGPGLHRHRSIGEPGDCEGRAVRASALRLAVPSGKGWAYKGSAFVHQPNPSFERTSPKRLRRFGAAAQVKR